MFFAQGYLGVSSLGVGKVQTLDSVRFREWHGFFSEPGHLTPLDYRKAIPCGGCWASRRPSLLLGNFGSEVSQLQIVVLIRGYLGPTLQERVGTGDSGDSLVDGPISLCRLSGFTGCRCRTLAYSIFSTMRAFAA